MPHRHARLPAGWSDRPGAPGAVEGADGTCATVPVVVGELPAAAESSRATARSLGFPAMRGDAGPRFPAIPSLTPRCCARGRRRARGPSPGSPARCGGGYIAGLTARQRTRALTGLPHALRGRLLAGMRRARAGSPRDVVGGDRRVDVVDGSDPAGGGTTPYVSWPVWQALDPGAAPSQATVRAALRLFRGTTGAQRPASAVTSGVGVARWTEACGWPRTSCAATCARRQARRPSTRRRGASRASPARRRSRAPGSLAVAPGGLASIAAAWGGSSAAAVTVRLTSAQLPPEALAAYVVAGTPARLAVQVQVDAVSR